MRPERKKPDQGQSGWVPITLLSLALHLTAIVSIPEVPPAAPPKPAPIQFELVPPTPTPSPTAEPSPEPSPLPSPSASAMPSPPPPPTPSPTPPAPSPSPEAPKPSPAEKPPEPEKKPEEKKPEKAEEKKPEPKPKPSVAPPPKPSPPPPPPPMMGRKVRLGPTLEAMPENPSGKAPPPPVMAKAPKDAKPGVPDQDKKDGGSPEKKKLKAPIKIAPAPPVANRSKPKPAPKKLATRKGARDGVERTKTEKPKLKKGAPKQGARSALKALEDLAEPGGVQEDVPKPARRPVEVEKPEPDVEEGDKDGEEIELAKEEPPAPGADGEVPEGKDPAADEEGFIPLTEALRRRGGGANANIVPNWISSNMSQDGDVGLDEYKAALLAQIQRSKIYPQGWDPNSWAGASQVAGTVDGFTGRLISVWLVQSSGRRDIDRAALQTIVRASPFPPIGTAGVLRFQIAIRYGPEQHAASAP